MFVKTAGEVAFQQPVIVDSLGNNATHKLKVAEVVGIAVRRRVYSVCDAVAWGGAKQGVHRVEHLSGDYHVPLPQKAAGILTLLPFKHNIPVRERG